MAKQRAKYEWDAESIKALREHMGLSQQALADELDCRQQTISEWETGIYKPRGLSSKLLSLVAERAGFEYTVSGEEEDSTEEGEEKGKP